MTTTLEFKAHENHLKNTVLRQAGTLWKAILEAVMNSVDAGATRCSITLTSEHAIIDDDGRGFKDNQEIEDYFQTFGTPHEDNDAVYGEFRMGRGQIMAFGVNRWHSNNFIMDVDIKNKGMSFELQEDAEPLEGCHIEIELYDKLLTSTLAEAERELEKFVKYVSIPVTLNNKVISTDPAEKKWDFVTDEAYIKLKSTGELNVYNLGVFVNDIGSWHFGTGGEVVSRERLKLNFARNDVMRRGHEKCPIWAKIEPHLKRTVTEKITKSERMNDTSRGALTRAILFNEFDIDSATELKDKKLFTDVRGRHWSLNGLERQSMKKKLYTVAPKGSKVGERVHMMEKVFVFSQDTAERVGLDDKDVYYLLAAKVNECHKNLTNPEYRSAYAREFDMEYIAMDKLKEGFDESFEFLETKDLTERQKVLLSVLDKNQPYLNSLRDRRIIFGECEVAYAWTDGTSYIALEVNFIDRLLTKYNFDIRLFVNIGLVLSHEFAHDSLDRVEHTHDMEFLEQYNDIVEGGVGNCEAFLGYSGLAEFSHACISVLPECLRRANRRLTKGQAEHIGRMEEAVLEYEKLDENEEFLEKIVVGNMTIKEAIRDLKKKLQERKQS